MAKQRRIVRDNPTFEALTYAPPELGPVEDGGGDPGLVLANVVFRAAVPIDIESVPIDELIRFRAAFEGERVSFYDGISKLSIFSVSIPASVTGAAWGLGIANPFALVAVGSLVVDGGEVGELRAVGEGNPLACMCLC